MGQKLSCRALSQHTPVRPAESRTASPSATSASQVKVYRLPRSAWETTPAVPASQKATARRSTVPPMPVWRKPEKGIAGDEPAPSRRPAAFEFREGAAVMSRRSPTPVQASLTMAG